ncbi:ABC transporter substrate-binding protein [Salinibacterium sp. TMP30]|uniref:ABC transporter substrate-binding protein n=1 Tax=Salinibacterium sp. TMP30 TaxID=3138237 RepID=UPI003139A04E
MLGESNDVVPHLADSWDLADDGKSVVFRLGDAVSNNGNEITSEDVKWSVERQLAQEAFIPSALGFIGRYDVDNLVEVIDDKTVQMNVVTSTSSDVIQFASPLLTIHDSTEAKKHVTDADPWANEFIRMNSANFGPWQVDRFQPNTEIVLSQNPNYTGERGNFETVTLRAVADSATRMQLVRSGDADWADALTFAEYDGLRDAEGVAIENCVAADRDEMFLQQDGEIFDDVRVRQAISMAIDRDQIVETIYRDFGESAKHGIPQYYDFPESGTSYKFDPEGAQKLLAEAGYPDGLTFTALFSPSRPGPWVEPLAIQIQADLKNIGVTMELNRVAGAAEFFQLVREGRYDAAFYSDSTFVGDATYGAAAFTLSNSNINSFGYDSAEYDALVGKAQEASAEDRGDLISQIADLAVADMPILYLVDSANVQAHRDNISGFSNSPLRTINPALMSVE